VSPPSSLTWQAGSVQLSPVINPHDPKKSKIKTDAEEKLEELQRITELRRCVRTERWEEAKKRGSLESVSDV